MMPILRTQTFWTAISSILILATLGYTLYRDKRRDRSLKFDDRDCKQYRESNDENIAFLKERSERHHGELKVIHRALIVLVMQTGGDSEMVSQLGLMPDVDISSIVNKIRRN